MNELRNVLKEYRVEGALLSLGVPIAQFSTDRSRLEFGSSEALLTFVSAKYEEAMMVNPDAVHHSIIDGTLVLALQGLQRNE